MFKYADISPCDQYRYSLWRAWDVSKPYCLFVGLNPSTADAVDDDPTTTRCVNFAKAWGYGSVCLVNLFAFRATKPPVMKAATDPIGPGNDVGMLMIHKHAGVTVAAWGTDGSHLGRDKEVINLLGPMQCLLITQGGHPGHPLFIKGDTTLRPFTPK